MAINRLPDDLLVLILSFLCIKDSVRTSVLSKRWEPLWLMVPGLVLDVFDLSHSPQFPTTFINKFLGQDWPIQKFSIRYNDHTVFFTRLYNWINIALARKVQHLYIRRYPTIHFIKSRMPLNMFKNNTLVSLKLGAVYIEALEFVVSLPCLKILHLQDIWYDSHDSLIVEKIVSGCPVLEDFTLDGFDYHNRTTMILRVKSQTLKRFCIKLMCYVIGTQSLVVIDAPNLEYLSFQDNDSDIIMVKNMSSLLTVYIDSAFSYLEDLDKKNAIRGFLLCFSSVRNMIISQPTLEVFWDLEWIPKFENLVCFEAPIFMLEIWPAFVENKTFPNLKKIILDGSDLWATQQVDFGCLPLGLIWRLEGIEIKELVMSKVTLRKLRRCLSRYSVGLNKLALRFKVSDVISEEDSLLFQWIRARVDRIYCCKVMIYQGMKLL